VVEGTWYDGRALFMSDVGVGYAIVSGDDGPEAGLGTVDLLV
jgi:hypothetical protein